MEAGTGAGAAGFGGGWWLVCGALCRRDGRWQSTRASTIHAHRPSCMDSYRLPSPLGPQRATAHRRAPGPPPLEPTCLVMRLRVSAFFCGNGESSARPAPYPIPSSLAWFDLVWAGIYNPAT